jgi:hypothetical protein
MTKLTPEQKLKYAILDLQYQWDDLALSTELNGEQIEDLWDEAEYIIDAMNEIRCTGTPTGLNAPYSRHYESEAVAVQCPNGEWVGFTYWYGGGKHGEPEAIDWIGHAYDVECFEEQKMMTVRTFKNLGEE